MHGWSLDNYRTIMNDPDRNVLPGFQTGSFSGIDRMRTASNFVPSNTFKSVATAYESPYQAPYRTVGSKLLEMRKSWRFWVSSGFSLFFTILLANTHFYTVEFH